jgi:hypothetical protein
VKERRTADRRRTATGRVRRNRWIGRFDSRV